VRRKKLAGSEKLLNRAGVRRKHALAIYIILTLLFTLLLISGLVYRQRNNPPTSVLGGLVAALPA